MGKKNMKPQQQQPVIRQTAAKAVSGLTEENLTQGTHHDCGAIPAADSGFWRGWCSFDGDDAE